jgi:hypothetical protein
MLEIPRFVLFPINTDLITHVPGIPFKYPILFVLFYHYHFLKESNGRLEFTQLQLVFNAFEQFIKA